LIGGPGMASPADLAGPKVDGMAAFYESVFVEGKTDAPRRPNAPSPPPSERVYEPGDG